MGGWLRRIPWRFVAAVGWCLAGVFAAVAGLQSVELDKRHLLVQWGNVPEWLAGVGTVATFGALFYAAREWRSAQAERRDREAEQARLIVVGPLSRASPEDLARREEIEAVITNHSPAPVFNLVISSGDDTPISGLPTKLNPVTVVPKIAEHGTVGVPRALLHQEGLRRTVLQPSQTTTSLKVIRNVVGVGHPLEWVTFAFTDAHGRRWQRTGSGQPVRLIGATSRRGFSTGRKSAGEGTG